MKMLVAVLLLCLASTQVLGEDCVVSTPLGVVQGFILMSREGKEFCSYRAIPYAQPPVGELRFKDPVPASPWTDVLDGTADGPLCVQSIQSLVIGQEDCLYLNVYTPQMTEPLDKPLPVLFFIFGGSFVIGSGVSYMYGPQHLMDKDVIVVTINYRLGVLGFLSTGDDVLPGNYGFKDMLLALQWTAQNIAAFGGDPGRVTIQGESAGSVAVHFLMLSPQSTGLFWAAIGESATALLSSISPPDDPLIEAQLQALVFNCSVVDAASIVDCLKQVDADVLVRGQLSIQWTVVVEKQSESNPKPFLTATPLEIILSGNFANVPWLTGVNREEALLAMPADILQQSGLDQVNSNFDSVPTTGLDLQASVNESMIPEVWQHIADFYLGDDHTVTLDNVLQYIHMFTDRGMAHPAHKAIALHTKAGKHPIYMYEFDYQGKYTYGHFYYTNGTRARLGAMHGDELLYLYQIVGMNGDWPEGHPDLEVVDALVTLWTNFAAYGNPTPANADNPQGVPWPAVARDGSHVIYYKLGQVSDPVGDDVTPLVISVEQDLFKERMDFWDSLPLKENQGQ